MVPFVRLTGGWAESQEQEACSAASNLQFANVSGPGVHRVRRMENGEWRTEPTLPDTSVVGVEQCNMPNVSRNLIKHFLRLFVYTNASSCVPSVVFPVHH